MSAAGTIALYLAFALQLPTPYSALTTVYIVANPVRGAIVSKSVWRIGGTVVGAVAAIVQTAVFAQAPLLFDAFIAAWMGVCCFVASLLRFFPSYGAVLAGYTVVIVDVGVFTDPENALATSLTRMSVVVLGVVSTGLVFLLTQRGTEPAFFERAIAARAAEVAALVRRVLAGGLDDAGRAERRRLALAITALEQDVVYAGSDSLAVRRRGVALRVAGTRLLGALTSGVHAATRLERDGPFGASFGAALARAGDPGAVRVLEAAAAGLAARRGEAPSLDTLAAVEQARDALERLARAIATARGHAPAGAPRLVPYLDWGGAWRNALRGFLVVVLASLGWYLTRAPAGPTLLAFLVPAAGLLSTLPSPGLAASRFALGATLATVVAVIVQTALLPQVTGFPLLMVVLLATAAPGIALQPHPTWGLSAFAYIVFMNSQIGVTNPQEFSVTAILANAEMYLFGCVALILVFRILLPPDPAASAATIARALAAAPARLARRRLLPDPLAWENTTLQAILRYGQRLDQTGTTARSARVAEATAALLLGRVVLQLRALGVAVDAFRGLRAAPLACAAALERAAGEAEDLRVRALLHEAARLMAEYAGFFGALPRTPPGGLPPGPRDFGAGGAPGAEQNGEASEAGLRPAPR